ncbi:aldehyde dehydrogenase [Collybia nuda]|uniref:Aldehyde dehydrogenase n=1 Tax=Collybia nuda TaxID=64659 RepID=A0A9P5XYW3_9AGAR|nr:aldehyde dehydrogenase [Collybia nuda]
MAPTFTPLIINGQDVSTSTQATFEVRNPFSRQVVGVSASASSEICKAAIESAVNAFKAWETSPSERRDVFLRAANIVTTDVYREKIKKAMQEETAATDYWCHYNWVGAASYLRAISGFVNELRGTTFTSGIVPGARVETHRRAMGVILAIAPWNAPFTLSLRAVAVPLICGNTVILKSSEYSPRSQILLVELFREAGIPKGVLSYLSMSKETAPALTAELIAHPSVRKINFTGSDRVGKILAMECAKNLKSCVLELGGKAPMIVLEDANIPEAAKAIAFGAMAHSGQICMSTERVIVQRGASASLLSSVRDLVKTLKAGDPVKDPTVNITALFTEASAENVLSMIREAQEAGAQLLLGDVHREGSLVKPHLMNGVKPGMRLWDRESFGPVTAFAVVDTIDEAIELANTSEYSLVSSVWTSNMYSAQRISSEVRAGYTDINGPTLHVEATISHIGLGGASGYGRFDIENFTDHRVVVTHPMGRQYPIP